MLVTQEMIFNKLLKIEKEIELIKSEKLGIQIKEYSEHKAAKLLGIGQRKLKQYVSDGLLLARLDKNRKSPTGYSFRFTHEEIKRFQQQQQNNPIADSTDIKKFSAKSIVDNFHKSRRKAS